MILSITLLSSKYKLKKKNDRFFFSNKYWEQLIFKNFIFTATKISLEKQKFFYLNNIKFNYIFLKFCESRLFFLNNILLFCLICNISIPHFCFHTDLSVVGNCRMCLVQFHSIIKPVASCAFNLTFNLNVLTETKFVKKTREAVVEFLLLNHPLDCPICDQGGECDLQEYSIIYGTDRSRLLNKKTFKRSISDIFNNQLIRFTLTRCIHCTRCVRFLAEIAGSFNLGMLGRGNSSEISTFINSSLVSELTSNIVEFCPVGALTNKWYSLNYRSWDSFYYTSIDLTDTFASSIRVQTFNFKIKRVLPKNNFILENSWISDRTRYFFDGLNRQRITFPMVSSFVFSSDFLISDLILCDKKEKITFQEFQIHCFNFLDQVLCINEYLKKNSFKSSHKILDRFLNLNKLMVFSENRLFRMMFHEEFFLFKPISWKEIGEIIRNFLYFENCHLNSVLGCSVDIQTIVYFKDFNVSNKNLQVYKTKRPKLNL